MNTRETGQSVVVLDQMHSKALNLRPRVEMQTEEALLQSMNEYALYLNTGFIDLLVATHPRKGNHLPEDAEFFVTAALKEDEEFLLGSKPVTGYFWVDGSAAFALCGRASPDEELKVLSIVSMMARERLADYAPRLKKHLPENDNSFIITQIQGPSKGRDEQIPTYGDLPEWLREYASAVNLLNSFQFERVMAKIVIGFAAGAGIDTVGILSAVQNAWYPKGMSDPIQERFKRRYDNTASELGFQVNPKGVHVLDVFSEFYSPNGASPDIR